MDELVDKEKERARLQKEKASCEKDIAMNEQKLQNENFVSKAPEHVVNQIRDKLAKSKERLAKIEESLKAL